MNICEPVNTNRYIVTAEIHIHVYDITKWKWHHK